MRFFALALLVAGANAAASDCATDNGNSVACAAGYDYDTANDAVVTDDTDDEATYTANCCAAKTSTYTGANSGATNEAITFGTTLTVTCTAGYEVAAGDDTYTVDLQADGTSFTIEQIDGADAACAAETGTYTAANTSAAAGTTITFATQATVTCLQGFQVADGDTDYTVDLNADGTFALEQVDNADAACTGITYTTITPTLAGITTAIPDSNLAALEIATYTGVFAFACNNGFTQDATVEAVVSAQDDQGDFTLTFSPVAPATELPTVVCVADTTDDTTDDDTTDDDTTDDDTTDDAGSASEGSATGDSATSPAALAAAGMAAVALLL